MLAGSAFNLVCTTGAIANVGIAKLAVRNPDILGRVCIGRYRDRRGMELRDVVRIHLEKLRFGHATSRCCAARNDGSTMLIAAFGYHAS